MSVKVTLSPRHAQILAKVAEAAARRISFRMTADEHDALPHALTRLHRAMDKHRVPHSGQSGAQALENAQ